MAEYLPPKEYKKRKRFELEPTSRQSHKACLHQNKEKYMHQEMDRQGVERPLHLNKRVSSVVDLIEEGGLHNCYKSTFLSDFFKEEEKDEEEQI
jgi:hypothetical protein